MLLHQFLRRLRNVLDDIPVLDRMAACQITRGIGPVGSAGTRLHPSFLMPIYRAWMIRIVITMIRYYLKTDGAVSASYHSLTGGSFRTAVCRVARLCTTV